MSLSEEQVQLLRDVVADLEEKVRRVRTPAGVRRYGQPIGAVIVADAVPRYSPRVTRRADSIVNTFRRVGLSNVVEVPKPPTQEIGAPETELLYGNPIDKYDLPETVYHVTTNFSAIRESGFIQASSGGGLGGSHKDSVSVTVDTNVAEQLAYDMQMYASLYRSQSNEAVLSRLREEFDRLDMTGFDEIERTMGTYMRPESPETFESTLDSITSLFFNMRSNQGKGRNPIILSGVWREDSPWRSIDPENIGIIDVPRSAIPDDALILDYDIGEDYGLEEARIYADIAIQKPQVEENLYTADSLDDEDDVVETIRLLPEETPVVPLKPNNLIDGVAVTEYNGKQAWEDLRSSGEPSDGRLEMASSMTVNRVEDTEDEGRVFTEEEEIQNYVDELLEEVGYGKRWISFTDNEDYLQNPDVKAAVSRGQTEMLDPEHPLYNKPVPVLIYRPSGISEFVLLHEVAHILEGCWKDPNHGDGHNWSWWETWGQLLKIKGLTVSRNQAQFLGASMEGMGVFDAV